MEPERATCTLARDAHGLRETPAVARPASAQTWKEIGRTKANTVVLVDLKSVKRMKDTVTVTSRVRFAEPQRIECRI